MAVLAAFNCFLLALEDFVNTYVSASILGADLADLKNEIARIELAGADMIHFDVMDGRFVENISFGLPVLECVKKYAKVPMDVHLMILEPIRYVERFAAAGADIITFHAEAGSDIEGTIDKIRLAGKKAGISIKPATPAGEILKFLDKVDMVLVMTVEPGFGGQGFIEGMLEKISELRFYARTKGLNFDIQVDGGINEKTAPLVREAGANNLVSGSYLFGAKDAAAAVASLKG